MTNNFEKDINVPSKEIIIKFSDGYCIVLENNEISIRENAFTKLCIEFGKQTNELLEFVKELYLDKKAKEQECEKLNSDNLYFVNKIISLELLTDEYEQALNEIEQYRVAEINDEDEAANDTILTIIDTVKDGK